MSQIVSSLLPKECDHTALYWIYSTALQMIGNWLHSFDIASIYIIPQITRLVLSNINKLHSLCIIKNNKTNKVFNVQVFLRLNNNLPCHLLQYDIYYNSYISINDIGKFLHSSIFVFIVYSTWRGCILRVIVDLDINGTQHWTKWFILCGQGKPQ